MKGGVGNSNDSGNWKYPKTVDKADDMYNRIKDTAIQGIINLFGIDILTSNVQSNLVWGGNVKESTNNHRETINSVRFDSL